MSAPYDVKLMDVTLEDPYFQMPSDERVWQVVNPPLPNSDDPNHAPYGVNYQPKDDENSVWTVIQPEGALYLVQSSTLVRRVKGVKLVRVL